MAESDYDPKQTYLIVNVKFDRAIDIKDCTSMLNPFAADGIHGDGDGTLFRIVPQSDERVAIQHAFNGKFINRWHGGDSDGTELGMYGSCDENSIWDMTFVPGKKNTVVFQSIGNRRCLNMSNEKNEAHELIVLWWGDDGKELP